MTTRPHNIALGVALIVSAVFMMSIQDALFKHLSSDVSLWQTFTLRGLFTLPVLTVVAIHSGEPRRLMASALGGWSLLRSLLMAAMFVTMYASTPFISLSTIAAGVYTAPVFITLLSAFAIGEPVGKRGWISVVMGFAGVLIILQPGADAFSFWAILPIVGGLSYALASVTTRSKCQTTSVMALALSLNLALLLLGGLLSVLLAAWNTGHDLANSNPYVFGGWSAVSAAGWLLIALLAVMAIVIGMGLAGAYKSAPPSIVATFDYSYLVFVALWDYLFFSGTLTRSAVLGIVLIVGSGLSVLQPSEQAALRDSEGWVG